MVSGSSERIEAHEVDIILLFMLIFFLFSFLFFLFSFLYCLRTHGHMGAFKNTVLSEIQRHIPASRSIRRISEPNLKYGQYIILMMVDDRGKYDR